MVSFYLDGLRVRVSISEDDYVATAAVGTFTEVEVVPDGVYEPGLVQDAVARVLYEDLGVHDGYRVETQLVTTEQGASTQSAIITVVVLSAALAALPEQIGQGVLASLIAAAVVKMLEQSDDG